jgi:DNA-binding NtrC family response regulator
MNMKKNIIVYSSDKSIIPILQEKYNISMISSRDELARSQDKESVYIIADCDLEHIKGPVLYKEIKKIFSDAQIIMLSSTVTIPEAVETAKYGLKDFIKKPVPQDKLLESIRNNFFHESTAKIKLSEKNDFSWLRGSGNRLKILIENIESAISEKKDILFIAETGIDILSLIRLVHASCGQGQRLTVIDIAQFQKESAENIFWTVLQESLPDSSEIYFMNFASIKPKQRESIVDYIRQKSLKTRINIYADARKMETEEEFNGWEKITVPSLKSRKEDINAILGAYILKYSAKYGKKIEQVSMDALSILTNYSWLGNYREFEIVLENAVISSQNGTIGLRDIQMSAQMLKENLLSAQPDDLLGFKCNLEKNIMNIINKKAGSEDVAANLLDIPKTKLLENLRK